MLNFEAELLANDERCSLCGGSGHIECGCAPGENCGPFCGKAVCPQCNV